MRFLIRSGNITIYLSAHSLFLYFFFMDETIVLQDLENLAAELGAEVRYDTFAGKGGLCRYGGKVYVILNEELTVHERVHLLSRELAKLPLDGVFIRPQIRHLLEGEDSEQVSDFDN